MKFFDFMFVAVVVWLLDKVVFPLWIVAVTILGANENRTLDQEEQKKFRKQALIILVLTDMAIIISYKIHIEVCQWLSNGMIVAALLNLCGKIQTKCRVYEN